MAYDRTMTASRTWDTLTKIYAEFGNLIKHQKAEGYSNTAVMEMYVQLLTYKSYGGNVNVAANGVNNTHSSFYSQF